jgi:hypothetical protein
MDTSEQTLTANISNQTPSPDEKPGGQSGSRKIVPIALTIGIVLVIGFIVVIVSNRTVKDKTATSQTNNTPTQIIETKAESSASKLESEASSIQVEDVESNLSEIDKDLKALN